MSKLKFYIADPDWNLVEVPWLTHMYWIANNAAPGLNYPRVKLTRCHCASVQTVFIGSMYGAFDTAILPDDGIPLITHSVSDDSYADAMTTHEDMVDIVYELTAEELERRLHA